MYLKLLSVSNWLGTFNPILIVSGFSDHLTKILNKNPLITDNISLGKQIN